MELPSKLVLIPVAVIVVLALVLVLVFAGGGDDEEAAKPVTSGPVSAKNLTVGTCIGDANSTTGDVTTFDAVACNKPHDGEVFTVIELEGDKYPGTKFVTGKGNRGCRARLRRQATAKQFKDRLLG